MEEKIKFKPLHEGMGFHPFSDGLPYAPESKAPGKLPPKTPSTGTGAVAAGAPRFVNQTENMNQRPAGTARQLQQQAQQKQSANPNLSTRTFPTQAGQTQTARAPHPVNPAHGPAITTAQIQAAIANARPQTTEAADLDAQVLRRRFFAYLMDTVIHAGFWLATNLTALLFFKFQIDAEILRANFLEFFLFFSVSQWMFIALQEMLFENSIGKVFFNLEFKRNHGSLLLRSIVFMMGIYCFGLGFIYRPQDKLGTIQLKSKIYAS